MKYYLDTEFIEGFHKPWLGRRRHYIDLVSIGIVCEDGRTYYAVSNEYRYKDASDWVKENVINPMYLDMVHGDQRNRLKADTFHYILGKSNEKILRELLVFFHCDLDELACYAPKGIQVYGYFADYDWVLFCSLFGRMIDLPKNFPMYCRDLKQMMADRGLDSEWKDEHCPEPQKAHNALEDAKWNFVLHRKILEYGK